MGNSSSSGEPSIYSQAKEGYSQLVNSIIRPPRCNYTLQHLGPAEFTFCGSAIKRTDFELRNKRGMKIMISHWEPVKRKGKALPCVIYMHGNASGRVEAIHIMSMVLSLGVTLLAFDFTGSGMSDGDYVSLGFYEKDDLEVVIDHLRSSGTTTTIALWGRSMGAATALMHAERDPSIACMILDSSFSSLVTLAEELVEKGRQQGMFAPSLLVSIAIRWIRQSVQSEAAFDIYDLSPIEKADRCFVPALFVAAHGDAFIPTTHSQAIHDAYIGDKNIILVDGDHSSARPRFLFDSASIFLVNHLSIPTGWVSAEGQRNVMVPPWRAKSGFGIVNDVMGIFNPTQDLLDFENDPFSPAPGVNRGGNHRSNRGSQRMRGGDVDVSTRRGGGAMETTTISGSSNGGKTSAVAANLAAGQTAMGSAEVAAIQQTLFSTFAQGQHSSITKAAAVRVPMGDADSGGDSSDDNDVAGTWTCPRCTLNNVAGTGSCGACEMQRPA